MIIKEQHCQVLIIGAGPSGLMMAAQLLRYGVQPVIIDSRLGPTKKSKALIVQARSLEMFRQLGIADTVLSGGKPARGFAFCDAEQESIELDIANIAEVDTLYPFLFVYPQSSTERILLEHLAANCCPVYWGTTLTSINQTADQAIAKLSYQDTSVTLTADLLIGADGARSTFRKLLDIDFIGDTYKSLFYLIDAKITGDNGTDLIRAYLTDKGILGLFPMSSDGRYRIIGNLPDDLALTDQDLKPSDLLPLLRAATGQQINFEDVSWSATYKLHHRMANTFRKQRCFLIGDAAHIHSPVGGQGMNTGLQDADNLGWKAAMVVNKLADPKLLDSFAAERMPVAQTLLRSTDRAFKLAISDNFFIRKFRRLLLPGIIRKLWAKPRVRTFFFRGVSQIAINYRESKLSLHLSQSKNIKAGDRLPYLVIHDEKKDQKTDLHQWCTKPGFTLIIMGKVIDEELFKIAKWLTQNHNGYINFFYLPPSNKNHHVFDTFEIAKSQHRSILVRPDMHIGFMNDAIDLDRMDAYLHDVVGLKHS